MDETHSSTRLFGSLLLSTEASVSAGVVRSPSADDLEAPALATRSRLPCGAQVSVCPPSVGTIETRPLRRQAGRRDGSLPQSREERGSPGSSQTTGSGHGDACGPARRHCEFCRRRDDARQIRSGSKRGCRRASGSAGTRTRRAPVRRPACRAEHRACDSRAVRFCPDLGLAALPVEFRRTDLDRLASALRLSSSCRATAVALNLLFPLERAELDRNRRRTARRNIWHV